MRSLIITQLARSMCLWGNGSDEVLAHAFHGLFQHGKPLLFPDISYSFYPVYCGLYGIEQQQVPLDDDFQIRVEDYQQPQRGNYFPRIRMRQPAVC